MGDSRWFAEFEALTARDPKLLFTSVSCILVLLIYVNLNYLESPLLGFAASVPYFLINGVFLGNALLKNETAFFRLTLGVLLLIMMLGFLGWLSVIIYNLDITKFTLVLFIATTLSSLLNRKAKNKNVK